MILIQNENELRRYIPNAFTTVKGETPLLQKLTPYLESAELWLKQYFNVVKTTVLLSDIADFAAMNAVYAEFFEGDKPARVCYQVAALPLGVKVEIDAVAFQE